MSGGKAFFDTNVLLYVYSSADPAKQAGLSPYTASTLSKAVRY